MMAITLRPDDATRLARLCGMFGSDFEGERAVAAAKADQLVRSLGFTWTDIIAAAVVSPPESTVRASDDWRTICKACLAAPELLSPRELDFLTTLARRGRPPSPKQSRWLGDIWNRVGAWGAA